MTQARISALEHALRRASERFGWLENHVQSDFAKAACRDLMNEMWAAQSPPAQKTPKNFSAEICAETGHIRMEEDGPCIFCDAPATDPLDEYCEEHGTSGGGEPGGVWRKSHCPECESA